MTLERVVAVLLIFLCIPLLFRLAGRAGARRAPAECDRVICVLCLAVLLIAAFLLLFGEIDFTGLPVFDGYGFSI